MKKIRIGLIGIGAVSGMHINGILRCADAELTAICDVNPDSLTYIGNKYNIPEDHRFSDYRDLIACPEVDAISNCTANFLHFDVIMAVLRAKKPLLTEKPMTMNQEEAETALAAARQAGVPTMIGFSYRFHPAIRYARDIVKSGKLGELYLVYGQYKQSGGVRREVPRVWRYDKALAGTGALGDVGSHLVDMACFVTGSEYVSVSADMGTLVKKRISAKDYRVYYTEEGRQIELDSETPHWEDVDVDDFSNMHLQMENGVSTALEVTRCAYGRGNYQRLEVYGSEGALMYENDANGDNQFKLYLCHEPGQPNFRIGATMTQSRAYVQLDIPPQYQENELQCFFDLIRGREDETFPTLEDGYKNMVVLDACVQSHEEGRRIALPV